MDDQFKSHQYKEKLRQNIRGDQDMTETIITSTSNNIEKKKNNTSNPRLIAMEFSPDNSQHLSEITKMGIQVQLLNDGQVQLVHISSSAESIDDAENGIVFMQEMIELMKHTNTMDNFQIYPSLLSVIPLMIPSLDKSMEFIVSTAQFGKQLHKTQG
ncbi:unnamed protein product, partial [Rotaria magnacalcarata]